MTTKKILVLFLAAASSLSAKPRIINPDRMTATSFAIVVDRVTYAKAEQAINAYRSAIEKDGLATYILIDNWPNPEAIRQELNRLYHSQPPLEGVVFVGDIPVPMIRDAQHLTSAFKMDQDRYPYHRSSVPSDRFYDDFDLKFDFLQRDANDTTLFYYSLRADSPQRIDREIYSARIKAPVNDTTRFRLISSYLRRVAQQKTSLGYLDTILTFHGHGYHSESLTAWQDQTFAFREQFPYLTSGKGEITDLHHSMQSDLKVKVLQKLQNPTLDLAVFHAHGEYEAQLLTGYPPSEMLDQNVEAIKRFLRNRLRETQRRGQSISETKKRYQEQYQFPENWFEGYDSDSLRRSDSLYAAMVDIYVEDIQQIKPQPKVVIFDECFNGGFIHSPYIAGAYLFGQGQVITAVANTVNVKQDLWADEHLGLLAMGVRIGSWHKERVFLESHLFGDPTLRFQPITTQNDFAEAFYSGRLNLKKELAHPWATRRAWAVYTLYRQQGPKSAPQLVKIYRSDPAYNVRLEALKCLAALRVPEFENLLYQSITDQFELIRRFSANWMGLVGKEEYLPCLADRLVNDGSERVRFVAKTAMEKISSRHALSALQTAVEKLPFTPFNQKYINSLLGPFRQGAAQPPWQEIVATIKQDSLALKKRIEAVRTLRNYQYQEALLELISYAQNAHFPLALRLALIETLGWYNGSHKRENILAACRAIMEEKSAPKEVIQSAQKTNLRILTGPNEPCGW